MTDISPLKTVGISSFGSATIWTTFAIMLLASITFTVQMTKVPREYRTLPQLTMVATILSTLSYFAMALAEGLVTDVETHRLALYARAVEWSLSSPLLLIQLSLIASLDFMSILYLVAFDELMIVSELFATFDHSEIRWIWYAISIAFWIPIAKQLFVATHLKADSLGKFYDVLTSWALFLWTLYPFVWGLSMSGNGISLDSEIASYAFLDIGTKVVFGASLVFNKEFAHIDQSYARIMGNPDQSLGGHSESLHPEERESLLQTPDERESRRDDRH